jgi:hypothetical protein
MRFAILLVVCAGISAGIVGCSSDGVAGNDDVDGGADAKPAGPDANVGAMPCDMTGVWISEQHVTSTALGADQNTTNWYYYKVMQTGDHFAVTDQLNCGFVVDGTTTVTLDDATLEALSTKEFAAVGRTGTFKPSADGQHCDFAFDRIYNLRGADKTMYLAGWKIGDPPKALSMFPALPTAPPGMQDWDADNMDGITLRSGLGNRYVAQRDYNEHAGTVAQFAAEFGGKGVITVKWDSQEGISQQTPPLLRVSATPKGDGWARYARADSTLKMGTGAHAALDTCRNVQQLAKSTWK